MQKMCPHCEGSQKVSDQSGITESEDSNFQFQNARYPAAMLTEYKIAGKSQQVVQAKQSFVHAKKQGQMWMDV